MVMTPSQHKKAAEGYLAAASQYLKRKPASNEEASGNYAAAQMAVSMANVHAVLAGVGPVYTRVGEVFHEDNEGVPTIVTGVDDVYHDLPDGTAVYVRPERPDGLKETNDAI